MKRSIVVAVLVAGCSSAVVDPDPSVPTDKVLLASFSGEVNTQNGTITIRQDETVGTDGRGALVEITGVTVTNEVGATPAVGTACTGGGASLGVAVRIKADPYVATTLYTDVYAQIQSMTSTGSEGCNNATLPSGLTSYGLGLWYYPTLGASNGVATFWAFKNPTGTRSTFRGKVYGTPTTVPATKLVFLTSTTYDGNLGGITGADAKCNTRAAVGIAAGTLPAGSTYKAFVSTNLLAAAGVVPSAAFVRTDGVIVAADQASFLSATHLANIDVTETGSPGGNFAWTGSNSDGTSVTDKNCTSWSSAAVGPKGMFGYPGMNADFWANWFDDYCNNLAALYCVQQ